LIAALDVGKGQEQHREIRTILQDVVVLATGTNVVNKIPRKLELDGNGSKVTQINLSADTTFTSITVEGKPEEIQNVVYILATAPGNLFAVLRHPNDRYQNPTKTTSVDDVLGRSVAPRMPAAVPPVVAPPVAPPPRALPKKKRPGFEAL
jgi:pilus assembly protein CpaB